ncbi:MAG: transcription antitermination factor NusB, partial [Planctomycetota bacterium]
MGVPIRRRTRARELALQMLYALELRGAEAMEELDAFVEHHTKRGPDPKGQNEVAGYARKLVTGTFEHRGDLNDWIEHIAENWRLERMAHIDRNVLRLAVYELLYETDVPFKVVINEAIDIAKRFSTSQSGSFVNGILDRARILIEEGRARGEGVPRPPAAPAPRAAAANAAA